MSGIEFMVLRFLFPFAIVIPEIFLITSLAWHKASTCEKDYLIAMEKQ